MKTFPSNQLKLLVHSAKLKGTEVLSRTLNKACTFKEETFSPNVIEKTSNILAAATMSKKELVKLPHHLSGICSLFPKTRTNLCGQEGTKSHCKQQEFVINNSLDSAKSPTPSRNSDKITFSSLSSLNKYLKNRGHFKEVFRGVQTNNSEKKTLYTNTEKDTHTKKYTAKDPSETNKSQVQETNNIQNFFFKPISKKLSELTEFVAEDFKTSPKLSTNEDPVKILTPVRDTSNEKTSPDVKFEFQNLRENLSGDTDSPKVFPDKTILSEENTGNVVSSSDMSKSIKFKQVDDSEEAAKKTERRNKDGSQPKKTRRKVPKKPGSKGGVRRRRRRIRWFSKIPIPPNVKGSVIFANGTTQDLDDPCKILSVNFSSCNLYPTEEQNLEKKGNLCDSNVQKMMENYDLCMSKIKTENYVKEAEKKECLPEEDNRVKPNCSNQQDDEMIRKTLEPIVRQKKVSKLDRTVKCFTTTVLPETLQSTKKRLKKVKHYSKSDSRAAPANYSNKTSVDIQNCTKTVSLADVSCHALTTNDLVSYEMTENDKEYDCGKNSCIQQVVGLIHDSGDDKNKPRNSIKKDFPILPGITRPVTQKTTHVNIMESKKVRPISSSWKNNTGKAKDLFVSRRATAIGNRPATSEISGFNYQQTRLKSTKKSVLSWKSRCDVESKPCHHQNTKEKTDEMFNRPMDWDYDEEVPEEILRRFNTRECPKHDMGCPITNEDLKHGPLLKKPLSAAALNRCNLDECKNRLRCRKPLYRCRDANSTNKPIGPGK